MKTKYIIFMKNDIGARILTNPSDALVSNHRNAGAVVLKNPIMDVASVPPHLWKYDLEKNRVYAEGVAPAEVNASVKLGDVPPIVQVKKKFDWKAYAISISGGMVGGLIVQLLFLMGKHG